MTAVDEARRILSDPTIVTRRYHDPTVAMLCIVIERYARALDDTRAVVDLLDDAADR